MNELTMRSMKKSKDTLAQMKMGTEQHKSRGKMGEDNGGREMEKGFQERL